MSRRVGWRPKLPTEPPPAGAKPPLSPTQPPPVTIRVHHDRRDLFAAAALTGLLAQRGGETWTPEGAVRLAWHHADLMLTEGEKP